ncbi:hypothetical protein GCM10010103_68740 [Streptomyces paradoxus]|uniref:Uncharacterized protein n=1 Tax=Streptomyces paradoxus TaxID=66375 RepID=A0A7W9WKT4_9ACTN|nr:hypothetical protein [Streptomyces paradoxus]MBB6080748.1 hypothetical protein [Streptomyces paradoxus]
MRSVMWVLLAVVALGVGVASASEIRGALEREREYRGASACAAAPVEASGCVWEQQFTVRRAAMNRGERSESPVAELVLPSGKPWEVTFRRTEPVMSGMQPGEKVVGVIWHGQVVEVRDSERRRQQTSDGPVGWPEDRLGGALACVSFGLAALVGGLWPLFARGEPRHATAAKMVRWHGVALGGTATLTLWAQAANDWPLWALPAIWGPLALLLLTSMTAFTLGALRGDLDHDAPAPPEPQPQPS